MPKTKITNKQNHSLRRYWVWIIAFAIALLNFYTFLPGYGQVPTPTPQIGTVPDFIFTPTPKPKDTPIPVATPVVEEPTATSVNPPPSNGGGNPNPSPVDNPPAANPPAQNDNATTQSAALQPQSEITLTAVVTATTLNMHRAPGESERLFDTLFAEDEVQVLARNVDGSWWLVCCGNRTGQSGWVNAAFLAPNFDRTLVLRLLPLASGLESTTFTTSTLQLSMVTTPTLLWQGQSLQLQLVVANTGNQPVQNVRLRDHLPAELRYQQTVAQRNAIVRPQKNADGSTIINATWQQIAANAQVTLTLSLTLDPTVPNGTLIDNLAVVSGQVNGETTGEVTTGITIALPPHHLPRFR